MGRPPHSETYPQPSKCNHRPKIDGVCIAWPSNEQSPKQQRDHPNAESNYRRSRPARHVSINKFVESIETHRSHSPNTTSIAPMIAVVSASMWPLHMKSIAWRWQKAVGRILQRYGLLLPSLTR